MGGDFRGKKGAGEQLGWGQNGKVPPRPTRTSLKVLWSRFLLRSKYTFAQLGSTGLCLSIPSKHCTQESRGNALIHRHSWRQEARCKHCPWHCGSLFWSTHLSGEGGRGISPIVSKNRAGLEDLSGEQRVLPYFITNTLVETAAASQ